MQNTNSIDLSIVERLSGDPIRHVHLTKLKTRQTRENAVKSVMLNSSSELNISK